MTSAAEDPIRFEAPRDIRHAHRAAGFEQVLHVFDLHWHGIRSATGCLPGRKLGISHKRPLAPEEQRHIEGLIVRHGITSVCYQGYSEIADGLVAYLHERFGPDLRQSAVTHVTSAQFEHQFEMKMLSRMVGQRRDGLLHRLGSVKQDFAAVVPEFEPTPLINLPPSVPARGETLRAEGVALVPLENTWRKNLYTNLLAALGSRSIERVASIHTPTGFGDVRRTPRLKIIGFQSPADLFGHMAASSIVLNVSLSECQPMAQLETLALGTPCLTGPLGLEPFSSHPLGRLTEVPYPDNPARITAQLDAVLALQRNDPAELAGMMRDFLERRIAAGIDSYRRFLEI